MSLPGRRPMSKEILQISLYGDISIRLGERDIAGELSKKSVGLIAYLLCAPGRQVSKDTLRDLLWIDAGDKAAYNLRFNLWNIKKHIPQTCGQEFIINSGGMCGVNPAYPFERTDIEGISRGGGRHEAEQILAAGNSLVFMEHFYIKNCDEFNDWLSLERTERERKVISLLSDAAGYFEEKGEFDRASELLKKIIFLSPFEDDFHIRLMKLYAAEQKFSEAISEYRGYTARLKKELGIAPSRDLREACRAIARVQTDAEARTINIKDKVYNSDYAAATEMFREILCDIGESITVHIENWNNLDGRSREFLDSLIRERIITIGR